MPIGPGLYDPECSQARKSAQAQGCLLIIIGGNRGSGFSIQLSLEGLRRANVAGMLREMADEIDQALKEDYENYQRRN